VAAEVRCGYHVHVCNLELRLSDGEWLFHPRSRHGFGDEERGPGQPGCVGYGCCQRNRKGYIGQTC
jgi:hypothetical protein